MNPQQTSTAVGARTVRVVGVVEETRDARSILVELHPDEVGELTYSPGQFLTVRVPDVGTGTARCYSLSSSPHVDSTMKITVKRVIGGHGSNWLCDSLAVGDELEILPPAGVFKARALDEPIILVAGGSGITPIMSIVKSILFAGTGTIFLIYTNRDENSVIFAEELRDLSEKFDSRFTVIHVLESVQGYLTETMMAKLVKLQVGQAVYVCGPAPLMKVVKQTCVSQGIPQSDVMMEKFVSLTTDPFVALSGDRRPEGAAGIDGTGRDVEDRAGTVLVTLDGVERTLAWPRSKRLLDALLDAGLKAPFSCREGACSACVCSLKEGEVKLVRNEVLEAEDLARGYILTCQAELVTDDITIEF